MHKKAFTLVELAIVIVIIGLLVGGVLAGRELIEQAKIRAQIKQFSSIDTAALTFKSKYGFIPGDVPEGAAAKFNFTWGSPMGGNGKLEDSVGNIPNISTFYENSHFFFHLSQTKLIKEHLYQVGGTSLIFQKYPKSEMGDWGIAAVGMRDGVNYFLGPTKKVTDINDDRFTRISPTPALSPTNAQSLDDKLDDGIPSQGIVRAVIVSTSVANNFANDTQTDNCLGADDKTYAVSEQFLCRLVVKSKVD
jgi:prepilin-type N-terminal cleavage/methylation domain-containing protein